MPYRLLKFAFHKDHPEPRMFPAAKDLRKSYDVVIIGAGGHGLAAAYYLTRDHGIKDIAVLEKGYIGGGNTGRNTTIVRSNYLTPEGVRFYDESVRLFEDLSEDFDLNVFYSKRGHFTLAHSDGVLNTMRWRAEVNKQLGIDSEEVDPQEIGRLCPELDLQCNERPVLGALYHGPGAVVRHDAVAWGYGRGAYQRGAQIHQRTEVTGMEVKNGRVVKIRTNRGDVSAGKVLCAVAGSTPRITQMAGLRTPITISPLQACVSEPHKPWLNTIIVSADLHTYISQSSRGELVMGSALDPYELHSTRSTLEFVEGLTDHALDLFPFLSELKVVRQWAGMADITPDFAPIMGKTPLKNFYLDAGWGTWGFKATPVCGKTMSSTVAEDRNHELIEPFRLSRFQEHELTGEKGAASVGH